MTGAPGWIDHPDLVEYYTTHRNHPDELYPSERRFLPWLAARSASVLDVGCGAGGFAAVWSAYQPRIAYTGVDISEPLLAQARERYSRHRFIQADCVAGLPLEGRCADTVAALGWLHWELRYAVALTELWRVTGRHLFFDLRLLDVGSGETAGTQRLALLDEWDGHTTVPYICVPWSEITKLLESLEPARILAHGYWGKPADTVMGVNSKVCFATFVLERRVPGDNRRAEVALDLPLRWPGSPARGLTLGGPERLAEIVPPAGENVA